MTPLIRRLQNVLREHRTSEWHPYTVPGLWVGSDTPVTFPSAAHYLLHQMSTLDHAERRARSRSWTLDRTLVYNCLVRHVTSYHHGSGVAQDGWRTTGTFLKLIGLLPYLLDLGVDTICLLPITEVGRTGRKGTLGSPYAVRHPLHIEPSLAEPAVPMSVEDQARTFVEYCHALGIKVVLETVLRTASLDSELVPLSPQWFYWVDEERLLQQGDTLHAPEFSKESLDEITRKVANKDFKSLPEPTGEYQDLFSTPPLRIEADEQGWRGIGAKSKTLRIPGAFADWPADDPQPAWTDVTYLRLHDHPQYRYMAYNTLRMFERELDDDQYRQFPLWNTISAVIPYYIRVLNIDGAMIDMGHALPKALMRRIVTEARQARPGFLLFEENFHLEQQSADAGYDAAVGYLPFDAHRPEQLIAFMRRVESANVPIRFFATPETHNTPRATMRFADSSEAFHVWQMLRLLPGAVGFLHAGMELGEGTPVNTGLEFTEAEQQEWTSDKLPLFSDVPLHWDEGGLCMRALKSLNRTVMSIDVVKAFAPDDRITILTDNVSYVGFIRMVQNDRRGLLVLHDLSGQATEHTVELPRTVRHVSVDPSYTRHGQRITVRLEPRQTIFIPVA